MEIIEDELDFIINKSFYDKKESISEDSKDEGWFQSSCEDKWVEIDDCWIWGNFENKDRIYWIN